MGPAAPAPPQRRAGQFELKTPRMNSRISVPITETKIEPRQPDRLEKKRNRLACYPRRVARNG